MALKLKRVKAGEYTAYDGRYLILQEPETPWGGGPRMWLVYDETYGGDDAGKRDSGVCMEPVESLRQLRGQLENYHQRVLGLESERDDEALPDHQRVSAAIKLAGPMGGPELAEQFNWPLDRVQAALEHPKQTASKTDQGAFGSF